VQTVDLSIPFEWNLKYSIGQLGPVERINSNQSVFIVSHCYKSVTFALLRLKISDNFDTSDCSKRSEQLPQNIFVSGRRQIVDENANPEPGRTGQTSSVHSNSSNCRRASRTSSAEQNLKSSTPPTNASISSIQNSSYTTIKWQKSKSKKKTNI